MARSNLVPGKPGPGRPPGSRNKLGVAAKEAIQRAAENLGGPDRLTAWAKEAPENERAFWSTIYPKLLPLQVDGAGVNGEHIHKVAWEIVGSDRKGG